MPLNCFSGILTSDQSLNNEYIRTVTMRIKVVECIDREGLGRPQCPEL